MKRLPRLSARLLACGVLVSFLTGAGAHLVDADDDAALPAQEAEVTEEAPPSEEPTADPEVRALELLQKSRDSLFLRRSVSAKLKEIVAIGGGRFQASGTYEAGEFPRLRLSFEMKVGSTTGELLEVCDGQLLWTEQKLQTIHSDKPAVTISRTVIDDVYNAWEDNQDIPEAVLTAKLGFGGLPALLAALERAMTFGGVKTDDYEGHSYSVIQGRWNDEFLARLGGGQDRPLPDYVPDRVRIYFDQETLFPTKVVYLKKTPAESRRPYRVVMSLEFSEIVLDGPVNEERFRYIPPDDVDVENRTSKILGLIDAVKNPQPADGETP